MMRGSGTAPVEEGGTVRRSEPTINDVAARAGVSKGTVSKYLNVANGYSVAPATRERIEAAIQELGFHPSPIARGLTSGATMTIGLVIADITNYFYPELVASVQATVEAAGYTLVLGSSGRDPQRELDIIRSMTHRRVDGLLLASVNSGWRDIGAVGVPLVLASRDLPELVADTVVVENRAGSVAAVEHLRSLGHRRIDHVAGDARAKPFLDRRRGFDEATADLPGSRVVETRASMDEGRLAARELLTAESPPTAIVFGGDTMALGGLIACAELGLRVPADVSIVGFDNIKAAALPGVGLTTVDSAATWVGARGAELLLSRITEDPAARRPAELHVRAARLVVRTSSAGPATHASP